MESQPNLKESQESKEEGNNQSSSFRSRKYVFTLNNYQEDDVEKLKIYLISSALKWVFGREVGESGTPHLQGYIEFKTQRKWSQIIEKCPCLGRAWSTGAKGDVKANCKYTTKDKNFEYGGFPLEKYIYRVEIPVMFEWQEEIVKELKETPNDRTINWVWEEKGCAGKTTFQKWIFQNFDDVVVLSGKGSDMKNGVLQWMNNKDGVPPSVVLINIPRVSADFVSFEGIESIKDMFFFSGKYEGGMVCGKPPHVYIFANSEPDLSKMSSDRWNIRCIGDDSI